MTDNAMIALLLTLLRDGLAAAGVLGVKVKQSYQPTQQGAESGPAVYLHKIGDVPRGAASVAERWDAVSQAQIRIEAQEFETTWQIDALTPQDPANVTALTATDVVNAAVMIMQSRAVRELLTSNGLGILRIVNVRAPFVTDDSDRQASAPNFEFTITHTRTLRTPVPVVETTEYRLARI